MPSPRTSRIGPSQSATRHQTPEPPELEHREPNRPKPDEYESKRCPSPGAPKEVMSAVAAIRERTPPREVAEVVAVEVIRGAS
jgi:hypothetical protein